MTQITKKIQKCLETLDRAGQLAATGESQVAFSGAYQKVARALDVAGLTTHRDGWAKWHRVAAYIREAAFDLEKYDIGTAAILAGLANEIAPAIDPAWGEKADRLEQMYPHQN